MLVMAGDRTLYYADFFELPGIDYLVKTQMHNESNFECNMIYVDGHLESHEVQPAPNNLRNGKYQVLLNN